MNHPEVRCWRCGAAADVDWVDIQSFGEATPRHIPGAALCATPGCVDVDGSQETSADLPTLAELLARAQQVMARFWATATDYRLAVDAP